MAGYSRIPFMKTRGQLNGLSAPGEIPDSLWKGMAPGVAMNASNRRSYNFTDREQDRSVESAGGIGRLFNQMSPASGFLGGPAIGIVRPPKNAVPGWAGFFGWVANVHPEIYYQIRVALPDYVGDIETLRSGAAQLGAVDDGVPVDTGYASSGVYSDLFSTPTTTMNLPSIPDIGDGEAVSSGAPTKTDSSTSQLVNTIASIGSSILNLTQDQKLFNTNLQRAAAGKPPLSASSYLNPNAGINFGMTPGTQSTLLMLAAGLGGVFLLSRFLKKR